MKTTTKFIILFYSVFLFMAGYHNMDAGQNMRYLEASLDITLTDITPLGVSLDSGKAYLLGVIMLFIGFILMFYLATSSFNHNNV